MTDEFRVGETYSLREIWQSLGGAMIVPGDRIITEELNWQRLTVGRLVEWLQMSIENGDIDETTLIVVDSDPEGNGFHPMRCEAGFAGEPPEHGYMPAELPAAPRKGPAPTITFGVGY